MRITACFLTGLLGKLTVIANNEPPESPRSFCHEELIYSQVFTGNLHCIRWVSRFATGFAWLPSDLKSSLSLKRTQYFYFMDGKPDRRATQFTPTLSSGAETELRPDNYVWTLAGRQHIWNKYCCAWKHPSNVQVSGIKTWHVLWELINSNLSCKTLTDQFWWHVAPAKDHGHCSTTFLQGRHDDSQPRILNLVNLLLAVLLSRPHNWQLLNWARLLEWEKW